MNGKVSVAMLRVLAVVSALALGGGFVTWRIVEARKAEHLESVEQAKAEEKNKEQETPLIIGTKNPSGRLITREEIDDLIEKRNDFIEPMPGIPEGSEEATDVVPMLPGSKSISMPLFTKRQIEALRADETKEDADTKEKLPQLLPGSKSSIAIPPVQEKSE